MRTIVARVGLVLGIASTLVLVMTGAIYPYMPRTFTLVCVGGLAVGLLLLGFSSLIPDRRRRSSRRK